MIDTRRKRPCKARRRDVLRRDPAFCARFREAEARVVIGSTHEVGPSSSHRPSLVSLERHDMCNVAVVTSQYRLEQLNGRSSPGVL